MRDSPVEIDSSDESLSGPTPRGDAVELMICHVPGRHCHTSTVRAHIDHHCHGVHVIDVRLQRLGRSRHDEKRCAIATFEDAEQAARCIRECTAPALFAECRICVSGFEHDDKDRLRQTIERHGGVYERNLSRDDTTHLLTEEGLAYLYKAESIDERRAMIAAVAGVTPASRQPVRRPAPQREEEPSRKRARRAPKKMDV